MVNSLATDGEEVYVSDLAEKATIVVRKRVPGNQDVERAESELRLVIADRLREAEVVGQ